MGSSADVPYVDTAYKLVEYAGRSVVKLSAAKATLPGAKQVFRGPRMHDTVARRGEDAPSGTVPLLELVMRNGRRLRPSPTTTLRSTFEAELEELPDDALRLTAPAVRIAATSCALRAHDRQVRSAAQAIAHRSLGRSFSLVLRSMWVFGLYRLRASPTMLDVKGMVMTMALPKHDTSKREVSPRRLEFFDRFFDDWPDGFRRPVFFWPERGLDPLRLEEFREDGTLVIRAELAGIDPDKDVEISVEDGVLHIGAERREEEKTEKRDYVRQEFRYGSFHRDLPLPTGVSEDDVKASYKDGILEVRVPMPKAEAAVSTSKKVAVAKG